MSCRRFPENCQLEFERCQKIHPKVLIDDLLKQTREQREHEVGAQPDLFADFNGIPKGVDKTEFYQHDQNWSNRMIPDPHRV